MAKNNPVRRAQLIAPFGVGAMVVVQDGTSLISGGLDHWYEYEGSDEARQVDQLEYRVEEWRLQRLLDVDHFQLPPDYRQTRRGETVPNSYLTVPFLRFPQWHFCPSCKRLQQVPLSDRGRIRCGECETKKKFRLLSQVPFVAMCDYGHIQDFPWREWVHRDRQTGCSMPIRLVATGGASLAAQKIVCDCGKERSLASITFAESDGSRTELSDNLDDQEQPFWCQGKRPWLGTEEGESCTRRLKGSLRSASNVYFADVRSAIYLPRGNASAPSELVTLLEEVPLSSLMQLVTSFSGKPPSAKVLRDQHTQLLAQYTDAQIEGAISIVANGDNTSPDSEQRREGSEDPETAFRRAEFDALRAARAEDQLMIRQTNLSDYGEVVREYLSRVMLVSKLRETRALAGFSRVVPENGVPLRDRQALLRLLPVYGQDAWLPAYVVFGEGIFLEVNEPMLKAWTLRADVAERISPLVRNYGQLQQNKRVRPRQITPRFVLLHTLSHLIMNRLTFECGYSSAALRERLYVSEDPDAPMAGLLIYTAAGDAEGTMGGLVRMGKPGLLEPVLRQALEGARWCSADPVCMEIGTRGGQGPDSCNLAACHNCSLVPETACEEFNRFLDRALVVGQFDMPTLGFFAAGLPST